MRQLDDLYPYKHDIVRELYIKTADENYVTARWCFSYGLHIDLFWLAAHSIEKYLKAALLLNERPAKKYSHNIESLFADVCPLAPELIPDKLIVPKNIPNDIFPIGGDSREEPTKKYVSRLFRYGQPDNRYNFVGYVRRGSDLIKFDQLVFAIRRLCQPLEAHFLGESVPDVPDQTRRERMLVDDPSSRNLHSNLEDIMSGKRGKPLRRVLLNWNVPFAPQQFRHGRMLYGWMAVNPVMVRRLLDPLDAGKPEADSHADCLWEWVNDNLHLPRGFNKAFEKARVDRKAAARANR